MSLAHLADIITRNHAYDIVVHHVGHELVHVIISKYLLSRPGGSWWRWDQVCLPAHVELYRLSEEHRP